MQQQSVMINLSGRELIIFHAALVALCERKDAAGWLHEGALALAPQLHRVMRDSGTVPRSTVAQLEREFNRTFKSNSGAIVV